MTVASFVTGSRDGDARAAGALARILKSRKLPTTFACAEQVHGHRIVVVPALPKAVKYDGADGLVTDQPDQPLAIFTADCASVFLTDRKHRVVGILHAGWRGARAGILAKAVRLIRRRWGIPAKDLQVWLGPSIGPCCFEVQWDVARYFPRTRKRAQGRWRVDLASELRRQAKSLGIRWRSKKPFEECTMHESRYFSYRRDRTNKRQVSIIMKRIKP